MPQYQLLTVPYNRDAAVNYATYWAYRRNPRYYQFDDIGGDCTNFVSQSIYAGSGVMNFTPTFGWYYIDLNDRAPSWTGVVYLYRFLTENLGAGPYGAEAPLSALKKGDVIQLRLKNRSEYNHTVLVTHPDPSGDPEKILIASHDNDALCRPLATYNYEEIRGIHIRGVRYIERATGVSAEEGSEEMTTESAEYPSE